MNERTKQDNISILKIKEILKSEYNIELSKSTIFRILRNKLYYRYRKTCVKNIDLEKIKYKIISFIFYKDYSKSNATKYEHDFYRWFSFIE